MNNNASWAAHPGQVPRQAGMPGPMGQQQNRVPPGPPAQANMGGQPGMGGRGNGGGPQIPPPLQHGPVPPNRGGPQMGGAQFAPRNGRQNVRNRSGSDSDSDSGSSGSSSGSRGSTSASSAPSSGDSSRGHRHHKSGGKRERDRSRNHSRRRESGYYGVSAAQNHHHNRQDMPYYRDHVPPFGGRGMMSPGSPPMTMPRDERSIRDAYDRGRQDLAEQIALGTARGGRSSPVPRLRPHIVQGGRILHDREELRERRGSFDDDLPPLDRLSLTEGVPPPRGERVAHERRPVAGPQARWWTARRASLHRGLRPQSPPLRETLPRLSPSRVQQARCLIYLFMIPFSS